MKSLREIAGLLLLTLALVVLFGGLRELRQEDYVAALLFVVSGLGLLGASTELLRPVVGE